MTEDDTFNRLRRPSYEELCSMLTLFWQSDQYLNDAGVFPYSTKDFVEQHGWGDDEFKYHPN